MKTIILMVGLMTSNLASAQYTKTITDLGNNIISVEAVTKGTLSFKVDTEYDMDILWQFEDNSDGSTDYIKYSIVSYDVIDTPQGEFLVFKLMLSSGSTFDLYLLSGGGRAIYFLSNCQLDYEGNVIY